MSPSTKLNFLEDATLFDIARQQYAGREHRNRVSHDMVMWIRGYCLTHPGLHHP